MSVPLQDGNILKTYDDGTFRIETPNGITVTTHHFKGSGVKQDEMTWFLQFLMVEGIGIGASMPLGPLGMLTGGGTALALAQNDWINPIGTTRWEIRYIMDVEKRAVPAGIAKYDVTYATLTFDIDSMGRSVFFKESTLVQSYSTGMTQRLCQSYGKQCILD